MRRKIFITLCSSLSVVFLISYLFIFFLFRSVLSQEIRQQQASLQKYNETIFTSYIDSFSMVPFQLVNDEKIGELVNIDNSSHLDMFRARELLRKKFNKYLNQQLFASNLDCRILFYLNDNIPLDSYCDAYTLSEHVELRTCQVYSSRLVKNQEWYLRTKKITWSPYFFINEDTDELCYSKYVYNYALNSSSEGIGTVVIAIPENAFLEKLSAGSITPNSRFFLSNEYQELLYASGEVSDHLFLSALSQNSGQILQDPDSHERYLISTSSVNQDLFLTFLTPFSDIEQMVISALFPYIFFVLIVFFLLICVLYLLSRKITEPIISLAALIGTTDDTKTFRTQRFEVYHDAELQVLCRSFTELIQKENTLMDQIIEENKAKRAAMLHALQAQINPHFLYNALDMVSWHALNKGEDSIADIVSSISNLMHYSISRPDATASLSQEIENIREFIRIYQMERPCDIRLITDFSSKQADQILIPKFTLQPLVENSILHNAESESLTILIQIVRLSDSIEISVTDDGTGADPEQLNAFLRYENTSLTVSSGFGIRNVNERLKLHFGNNSHLSYRRNFDGHLTASLLLMPSPLS